jgi:large subunit ribosomal protein L21
VPTHLDATTCLNPFSGLVAVSVSENVRRRRSAVYAIVKAGGRQEKVAVGDVFELDRISTAAGATLTLPALLLVDGDSVTSDASTLAGVTVTAEVVEHTKGPKIRIMHYKNKTGYRRRQGHRAQLTRVKITGIETA